MISKLPKWMLAGGVVLAFLAGMVNAVGYLGYRHQAVTHMTGNTSLLGIAASQGDSAGLLQIGGLLLAFVLGCAASGALIGDSTLRLGRRYGVALILESAMLLAVIPLLRSNHDIGLWLAAASMGLQNAMVASYSGTVVRTTHMSGITTDLGTMLGQWLRGVAVDPRRVRLYLALLLAFFAGGAIAGLAFPHWREETLLLPALLTGLAGISYMIRSHRSRA